MSEGLILPLPAMPGPYLETSERLLAATAKTSCEPCEVPLLLSFSLRVHRFLLCQVTDPS